MKLISIIRTLVKIPLSILIILAISLTGTSAAFAQVIQPPDTSNPAETPAAPLDQPAMEGITTQASGYSISGEVTDPDNNWLAGVTVNAYNSELVKIGSAVTNDSGVFSITKLPAGQYHLIANALPDPGFAGGYFNGELDPDTGEWVVSELQCSLPEARPIDLSSNVSGIYFQMSYAGTLSGTSFNQESTPMTGTKIVVKPAYGGLETSTLVDMNGNYEITGLASCDYSAQAEADGYPPLYYSFTETNVDYHLAFASTFFLTTEGMTIDFPFTPPPTPPIIGNITNSLGDPLSNVWVTIYAYDPAIDEYQEYASTQTDSKGAYYFLFVDESKYRIGFNGAAKFAGSGYWSNNKLECDVSQADLIDVVNGEQHTLDLQLGPETVISGIVKDNTGKPLVGAPVEASDSRQLMWFSAVTDKKGAYTIHGLSTCPYTVSAISGFETDEEQTIYYNNTYYPLDNTVVDLAQGPRTDINLQFLTGYNISGNVQDEFGSVPPDYTVIHLLNSNFDLITDSGVDPSDGSFNIPMVVQGTYYLDVSTEYSGNYHGVLILAVITPEAILLFPAKK